MATIKSIEEKAKAYDEALKVLHKYDGAHIMFTQDLKEEMFPELREVSEDEKIRKELIRVFSNREKYVINQSFGDINVSDILAWLEKQQKPTCGEEDEEIINKLIDICDEKQEDFPQLSIYFEELESVKDWLKSLKDRVQPQNRWKPSEGQLECLGYAIENAEINWSPLTNNRIYLTLKTLKEQLEKLREK